MSGRLGLFAVRNMNAMRFNAVPQRNIATALYKNVWKKSNVNYIAYVVAGCIAVEIVYGKVGDYVWETANQGKLYKDIDWSQFKSEDDE